MGGRFLQGLEQGVGRLGGGQIKVGDDGHAPTPLVGGEGQVMLHGADLVDLDVGAVRLDDDDVGMCALHGVGARPALAARGFGARAVEGGR